MVLARDCKHPDAEWLTSVFEGKDVTTNEDARKIFLLHQNDARALCFAWWLMAGGYYDNVMLCRAAEMGDALANAMLIPQTEEFDTKLRLAQLAAVKRDRDGFYWLGHCLHAWKENVILAKEQYLIAAQLGHVGAADAYGRLFDESQPMRWIWFARAASHGCSGSFLDSFSKQVELFFFGSGNATVVYLIGRALKGNIDAEKKFFFGTRRWNFDSLVEPANQAVSFYKSQIKAARLAVDTWALVATRLHLIKDMRIVIGKMIWEARFEANYLRLKEKRKLAKKAATKNECK